MVNKVKSYSPLMWIRALKDDTKFQHTQGMLGEKTPVDTYEACCLGVAAVDMGVAEIMEFGEIVVPTTKTDHDREDRIYGSVNPTSLPSQVRPKWLSKANMSKLIMINDAKTTTDYTPQIEYIEKYLVPKWRKQKSPQGR